MEVFLVILLKSIFFKEYAALEHFHSSFKFSLQNDIDMQIIKPL